MDVSLLAAKTSRPRRQHNPSITAWSVRVQRNRGAHSPRERGVLQRNYQPAGLLAIVTTGSDAWGPARMIGRQPGRGPAVRGITQLSLASFKRVPILFRTEVTNQPAGSAGRTRTLRPDLPSAAPEETSRDENELGVRVGLVRGRSPVALEGGWGDPDASDTDRFDVGLNYGAPSVRLRSADACHFDLQFLTSVTEVGFSVGLGGAVLLGDPYGSKLAFGFETIDVFGTRFYAQPDIVAAPGILLSPIVGTTDMPHVNRYGVRLLGEATFDVGAGFGLAARAGYQAPVSTSGGPSVGTMVSYAF